MLGDADHDGDDELNLHEFKTLVRKLAATDEVRIQVRRGGTRHRVLTTGEAPEDLRQIFKQRSRWCTGCFQVFFQVIAM